MAVTRLRRAWPLSIARPTGDPVFNFPRSMLFAPAVTVPLMSVGGVPVGVQLMGQEHEDARIAAMARWLVEAVHLSLLNRGTPTSRLANVLSWGRCHASAYGGSVTTACRCASPALTEGS